MIRLRPHHLLCMLTYKGEGYSPQFVENFDRLTRQIARGGPVEIVSGPDDICAPLLNGDCHCLNASVTERDQKACADLSQMLGQPVHPGIYLELTAARFAALRNAFRAGEIRSACDGCNWKELCDEIAAACFAGTRLTTLS